MLVASRLALLVVGRFVLRKNGCSIKRIERGVLQGTGAVAVGGKFKMNRFTFGAAFAVLLSPALAVADESQVTDCTEGCTVITCDEAKCAVNVFDRKVWRIAATYDAPTPNEEPRQARYEWKGSPEDAPAPSTAVLAPTDANNQLAKVCDATARSGCTIYKVSVDGAVELSES